jgi:sugar (pentulose or hexulose) kinase
MNALAMDLGGSGGKIFLGSLHAGKLSITEIHRFQNEPVEAAGHLYWDILNIYRNLLEGIRIAAPEGFGSVGIDAFCNDYGLLDADGRLINQVYMYRDMRTSGVPEQMDRIIDPMSLYRATGCQRARFNTLVQLYAQKTGSDGFLLDRASCLLFVPDLLNYFLCGRKAAEFTIASVSQAYNRNVNSWDIELLNKLGIRADLFPEVVAPAVTLGDAKPEILRATGANPFTVSSVCHHDTASAVMAIPAKDQPFVYISSGTWCLMGTETREMIVTEEAYRLNFANEGGFGGTNRFLKNIMGLWMVQECKRQLERNGITRSYAELDLEAERAPAFRSLIDPNDTRFFEPGDMIGRIQRQCAENGEPLPETPGEIIRCILESLAMTYRLTLEQIERLAQIHVPFVHVVGGGAKSALLNRFAASAMERTVLAGPIEAAAIGNLAAQYIAAGAIENRNDARQVIRNSFVVQEYHPENTKGWDTAYLRYLDIVSNTNRNK